MSTVIKSLCANIALQCFIATKKGKTQCLPRTHEQARDHAEEVHDILFLGPCLSDYCTREKMSNTFWKAEDEHDTSH